MSAKTRELLEFIYGSGASEIDPKLEALMNRYRERLAAPDGYTAGELPLDETSAIMISYGDSFHGSDGVPLSYLLKFLDDELKPGRIHTDRCKTVVPRFATELRDLLSCRVRFQQRVINQGRNLLALGCWR